MGRGFVGNLHQTGDMAIEGFRMPGTRGSPWNNFVATTVTFIAPSFSNLSNEVSRAAHDVEVPPTFFHLCVSPRENYVWVRGASGLGICVTADDDFRNLLFTVDPGLEDNGPLNLKDELEECL